jgi:hypothetical protein
VLCQNIVYKTFYFPCLLLVFGWAPSLPPFFSPPLPELIESGNFLQFQGVQHVGTLERSCCTSLQARTLPRNTATEMSQALMVITPPSGLVRVGASGALWQRPRGLTPLMQVRSVEGLQEPLLKKRIPIPNFLEGIIPLFETKYQ